MKKSISYSAIILDDKSRERLINRFRDLIGDNYEIIAHHMTINMGEILPEYEKFLYLPVSLKIETFAMDDKVAAVGVSGFPSANETPHVTLAVNRQGGGKPYMSNKLQDWQPVKRPLILRGVVTEVPLKF